MLVLNLTCYSETTIVRDRNLTQRCINLTWYCEIEPLSSKLTSQHFGYGFTGNQKTRLQIDNQSNEKDQTLRDVGPVIGVPVEGVALDTHYGK